MADVNSKQNKYSARVEKYIARANLYSAKREQPAVWRPIETAPKDGTWVLLRGGRCDEYTECYAENPQIEAGLERPVVAQFTKFRNGDFLEDGRWQYAWYDGGYCGEYLNPKEWMPIPE